MITRTAFAVIIALILFGFAARPLSASYYSKGCGYYSAKKYDKAREMLQKAVEESPDNGNAYFFLGEVEKLTGNYHRARECYQTALGKKNLNPKYRKLAHWNLSVLSDIKTDYPAMVRNLKAAWQKTGDAGSKKKVENLINKLMWSENAEAIELYKKGQQAAQTGVATQAETHFREAMQKDPAFLAPRFEIGMIQYRDGRADAAAANFREIAAKIPFYGEVHLLLGEIAYNARTYPAAVEHYGRALEFAFLDAAAEYEVVMKRATAALAADKPAEAKRDLLRIGRKKITVEAALLLSSIYIRESAYADALKTLKRTGAAGRTNPEVVFQYGIIAHLQKDEASIGHFDRLFDMTAGGAAPLPQKYYKAFRSNLKEHHANENHRRVIAIFEGLPEAARDRESYAYAALAYYRTGDYARAIPCFTKHPAEGDALFMLARSYALTGARPAAKETLARMHGSPALFRKALADDALNGLAREVDAEKKSAPRPDGSPAK
ncbi:MAG TPA: tetratricopeptide repeat protein [Spirochaetota bacterium]|mgnify:CR=1 FL=1|nr:tetratricopeptide repeat protein [Spirochaetota bacterium]HOS40948.1 tetratricopeptide repeat protein [Spirochaetota bacterium]HPU89347.1 tetratricopeptide repeat protein [Spirochaetota bacterium]